LRRSAAFGALLFVALCVVLHKLAKRERGLGGPGARGRLHRFVN